VNFPLQQDNGYPVQFSMKNKLYRLVASLMTVPEFLCETVQSIFAWNLSGPDGLCEILGCVYKRQRADFS
jgi:hypothetical protein